MTQFCAFVDKTCIGQGFVETRVPSDREWAESDREVLKRIEPYPVLLMRRHPGGDWELVTE